MGRILIYRDYMMDKLLKAAIEYEKLLNRDFIYTLENGLSITLNFQPQYFHHLIGLQKLKDIDVVTKNTTDQTRPILRPQTIYRNIRNGIISYDDISKSDFFLNMEDRLEYFSQINNLVEFEKIIIDFDVNLLNFHSNLTKANYVLHKKSNTNMHLNLFLGLTHKPTFENYPLTFIPSLTDLYTYGQQALRILEIKTITLK